MSKTRDLWIFIGIVIFVAVLVSGFVLTQPTAEDILVGALENAKSIKTGYAVVYIDIDTLERDASGKVEIWAERGKDGPGAFRINVIEASEAKALEAEIVSDGETLWAYSPSENKVYIGTPEEAQTLMENDEFLAGELDNFLQDRESYPADGEHEHPENAEEAVQKLTEYFNISRSASKMVAGEAADQLELEPIPDQMPDEYAAVGGMINLWIGQNSQLPLEVAYTGGSLGEIKATVEKFEINPTLDDSIFTFEVPGDAEVVTIADLEPQSLTLDEAIASAEFQFMLPGETPPGATLVDILNVRGALVTRYTLPSGGSFTIAQGFSDQDYGVRPSSVDGQTVEVRGTTGQLFTAEDGDQVFLTWSEGDLFYSVAGDMTPDQALAVAESLQ
jgi:outer membrane lipoprotein-sorting protein